MWARKVPCVRPGVVSHCRHVNQGHQIYVWLDMKGIHLSEWFSMSWKVNEAVVLSTWRSSPAWCLTVGGGNGAWIHPRPRAGPTQRYTRVHQVPELSSLSMLSLFRHGARVFGNTEIVVMKANF